ncbi:zeta toxin family protein [Clostridium senegalense]|uniref:zeta toxin family protein n=1 Tax=Clostridium senegalense TaxID=1465809 RepID=UPI001C0FB829|nr:zeta toxin family protein [Clostridium senegalense]MBU5228101.1 zeta toxin family protein [Clostridium senegalense]
MMNAKNDFPTYTILAGSNGAGKSTYRAFMHITDTTIDPDLIARVNKINEFEAGRLAVNEIRNCFKNKESFVQETTLSSSMNSNIDLAKLQGYKINLIYVAIDNPERAISNIKIRVKKGLHDIPEETVKRRFPKTYKNLISVSERVDNVIVVDNSNNLYNNILHIKDRQVIYRNENTPRWLNTTIDKVIENATKPKGKEILKVNKKELGMLEALKAENSKIKFKTNPYEADKATTSIIAQNSTIKLFNNFLNKYRGMER